MAGSVNKAILVGNLGRDPEVRHTNDGRPIVSFSVATSETWKDRNSGERREKTEWHRVVIFSEGLCRIAQQYLRKGSKVYIEGQLQTRKWTDQQGAERYTTEVVLNNFNSTMTMLDSRAGGGSGQDRPRHDDPGPGPGPGPGGEPAGAGGQPAPAPQADGSGFDDDNIPF